MRHKSGQIEQNNYQSNSNSSNAKATFFSSVPPLTDANYEFLFNQLLEGVAHGWHSKKIVKFFHRLGERGKQADWTAWLERFQSKISSTSSVSMRQMATLMMRLGEITQSTPEVQQIGQVSYQIGQQVLFGDTKNVIWEYVGTDFQPDSPSGDPQTQAEAKDENRSEFNHNLNGKTDSNLLPEIELNGSQISEVDLEKPLPAIEESVSELSLGNDSSNISLSSEAEVNLEASVLDTEEIIPELTLESDLSDASPSSEAEVKKVNLEAASAAPEEIIPELNSDRNLPEFNSASAKDRHPQAEKSTARQSNEPNLQELMKMIQENEKLVQQISKKLNISSANSSLSTDSRKIETVNKPSISQSQHDVRSNNLSGNSIENSVVELVETWFNLGLKQVSIGDFNGAIDSWEKALNLNPNLSEAWHNRGSALGRLSRYEEAIESFGRSLLVAPNNYQAWNDRAHALYQLEKWQEARESWEKAIEIMPGNHLFWYNRGCALEQLNNINESIASYEKALEIKPDFQPARSRYINLIADNSPPN